MKINKRVATKLCDIELEEAYHQVWAQVHKARQGFEAMQALQIVEDPIDMSRWMVSEALEVEINER